MTLIANGPEIILCFPVTLRRQQDDQMLSGSCDLHSNSTATNPAAVPRAEQGCSCIWHPGHMFSRSSAHVPWCLTLILPLIDPNHQSS